MPSDRMRRRHVREKAVIDHLADKMFEPAASIDEQPNRCPTTSKGLPVEGAGAKGVEPKKGGLPILYRK